MSEIKKWKEHLHGGKSDGKKPDDYKPDEIEVGKKVEREHTSDEDTATEIAMDHEQENDSYYDELVMSGIADEEDAIDTYNKIKSPEDKKKALDKIQNHINKEKDKLKKENRLYNFNNFVINEKKKSMKKKVIGGTYLIHDEREVPI